MPTSSMRIVARPCYVCGTTDNPLIASEIAERRFGRPLMPEGTYDFVRCRDCGTLYVDSEVDEQYLNGIYAEETILTGHESATTEEEAHRQVLDLRLPEFEQHWSLLKRLRTPATGENLLDMGCQMGDFGALALADGVIPHGIELSADYAGRCKARWGSASTIHRGPLSTAEFTPEQFKYITAFETLEHIMDPIGALKRFRTWLADDGLVAFSVPSSDYFHFKFWMLRRSKLSTVLRPIMKRYRPFYLKQVLPHTHIYNFSRASAMRMLVDAGFAPVEIALTGWHGSLAGPLSAVSRIVEATTHSRVNFAPSILAVGRKAPVPRDN